MDQWATHQFRWRLLRLTFAQSRESQGAFIRERAGLIAITHVVVLDGTGAAPQPDKTVILRDSRIDNMAPSTALSPPAGARVLDGTGHTLIPASSACTGSATSSATGIPWASRR